MKDYFSLFFKNFSKGIKTKVPEMIMDKISGPSICSLPVRMI